jgi:hypothetical protein
MVYDRIPLRYFPGNGGKQKRVIAEIMVLPLDIINRIVPVVHPGDENRVFAP